MNNRVRMQKVHKKLNDYVDYNLSKTYVAIIIEIGRGHTEVQKVAVLR